MTIKANLSGGSYPELPGSNGSYLMPPKCDQCGSSDCSGSCMTEPAVQVIGPTSGATINIPAPMARRMQDSDDGYDAMRDGGGGSQGATWRRTRSRERYGSPPRRGSQW